MRFLRILSTAVILAICFILPDSAAFAAAKKYINPIWGGDRLDWCFSWSAGCGKQAADAFCKAKGFDNAQGFSQAPDIGAVTPTRLISTGAVCDQNFCDGFSFIDCVSAAPTQQTFTKPKFKGNRLDWCFNWSVGCGEQAASAWCKSKGFAKASAWAMASDIGAVSPTRLIGTGAVCDQPFCDGFKWLVCQK